MPSFRFCRPDDAALLVEAVNRCYNIHFPDLPAFTLNDFKREVKEINLWSSSCMLALDDGKPVGVIIAAKRKASSLILRLGIHPDFQHLGFASHLLTSLRGKMAVLGPPLLTVELQENNENLCAFFEKQGFQVRRRYQDFSLSADLEPPAMPEIVIPIDVEDVVDRYVKSEEEEEEEDENEDEALRQAQGREEPLAWECCTQTLRNRKKQIKGIGVPDVDGMSAYLFYLETSPVPGGHEPPGVEIFGLGCREEEKAPVLLGLLLKYLSNEISPHIKIPKLSPSEISFSVIEEIGFQKDQSHVEYCIRALKDG